MLATARWMMHVDERILEALDEDELEGGALTPAMLAHDLDSDERFVYHRCYVLLNAGFVERIPRARMQDKFVISRWGELYLEGNLDAEHRQPQPSPRPPDKVRPGWWAGFV